MAHGTVFSSRCYIVQSNQEENGAGDVNKGVDPVDPMHQYRVLHEPLLDGNFPKHVKPLFKMDDLESVAAGYMDCIFNKSNGGKGSTKLVYLQRC